MVERKSEICREWNGNQTKDRRVSRGAGLRLTRRGGFWVIEVLSWSTSVPAPGEKRQHIRPLMPPSLFYSPEFTGHNFRQLLGSEFMVIVGKWNRISWPTTTMRNTLKFSTLLKYICTWHRRLLNPIQNYTLWSTPANQKGSCATSAIAHGIGMQIIWILRRIKIRRNSICAFWTKAFDNVKMSEVSVIATFLLVHYIRGDTLLQVQ